MKSILSRVVLILLFVAVPAQAADFVDYTLTSDHESVPCVRNLPQPRYLFDAQEHEEFYVIVVVDEVSIGDSVQFDWFFEDNLYSAGEPHVFEEPSRASICVGEGFDIPGTERENMTGEWSVKISVDGKYLVNYRFYLQGISSPTTSTTTTEDPKGPCALSVMYGGNSDQTEFCRLIRDRVLRNTHEGRELINLYYTWNPIIIEAMATDESFKKELKDIMDELLVLLEGTVE
jgi:hypothetical protein